MDESPVVSALVVYESFFGNTQSIAAAVASGLRLEGLRVTERDVADLGEVHPDHSDLLVVGGPTHAFALSRPSTRGDAAARGGEGRYAASGLREWLASLPLRDGTHLAAAFDTRVSKVRHLPMSAARSAWHVLRQRHYTMVGRPTGFLVHDIEGPLEQHELERAVSWGRALAREAQTLLAAERAPGGATDQHRRHGR